MAKILRVIDPFFVLDVDDTLVLSEDGKRYTAEKTEEFHTALPNHKDGSYDSSYSSTFVVSPAWAKQLIEEGFLEEVDEKSEKKNTFVNVFDEIDNLLKQYKNELDNISTTMAGEPECLKVEKTTVLSNIIKVLGHLKTLRK